MEKSMTLSAPWVKFYKEIVELFKDDPGVKIKYNSDDYVIDLYVEGQLKADALTELLPATKEFGNITVTINVIPADVDKADKTQLFKAAFEGNPVVSAIETIAAPFGDLTYVVFENRVVQFFNDDLSDINGNCSTLYQEIAREVFPEQPNIYFCTEADDELATINVSVE